MTASRAPQSPLAIWLYVFVLIQALAPGLLFFPGSQQFRPIIRAIPYVSSLLMLGLCLSQSKARHLSTWATLLIWALALLVVGTCVHPDSDATSGPAQCVFQLSIAAPAFWGARIVRDERTLGRLLWVLFLSNTASAVVGVLQAYYPQRFMPPEFSQAFTAHEGMVMQALSYEGADGRRIIRPPGLSDLPGGASLAGTTVALLGLLLGTQPGQSLIRRAFCVGMASVGILVLFLSQVRSLFLMVLVGVVLMCCLLVRQRRFVHSGYLAGLTGALVVAAFSWALTIGGKATEERFLGLIETGGVASYQQNRGHFVAASFGKWLTDYPLGAGVGRWGMMKSYFGERVVGQVMHAEIQLTGWLFDGGVLMWILYGGAILIALFQAYRMAIRRSTGLLSYYAAIIFCLNALVAGQGMAGPTFNTTMGIQFWLLAAALHGAASAQSQRVPWSQPARRYVNPTPPSACYP